MEPVSSLSLAWSLFQEISLGVGINELHRQLVKRLGAGDGESLNLQKALHRSLLSAVDTLAQSLSDSKHPYFQAIPDPVAREEEDRRVKELFRNIRARFPETGSLHSPINLLLRDEGQTDTDKLFRELGLEEDLELLPPVLRNTFRANLSLVMLAHFRHTLATDNRLGKLLHLDLTTAGFQRVQRELVAISAFLQERFGSDPPDQLRSLLDDLTTEFKNSVAQGLSGVRQDIQQVGESVINLERKLDRLPHLPDGDIFCLLTAGSGSLSIDRYLKHKERNRLYLDAKQLDDFVEKIERNGSLLIRGLPGTGKTTTGLAMAEALRYQQAPYTIFYVNLRYDVDEHSLVEGVKRRLTQPSLFFFDDCQGKYELTGNLLRRLGRVISHGEFRSLLLFAARVTPTPAGMSPDDSDFEEEFVTNDAVLPLRPTLSRFRHIITLTRPHFAGLSKERLVRVFEFTGRDLFLLEQLMELLETPADIDRLTPERLFEKTLRRYFGRRTVRRPNFMKLAALAQFELALPAEFLHFELRQEDAKAADELVILAGRPPRYYFLHSSAAELIFRALVWNAGRVDYATEASDYLISFFQDERLNGSLRREILLNVIEGQLGLKQGESEELAVKSRFLANENTIAFVERAFADLSLNVLAVCLNILHNTDEAAFARFYSLLRRQTETGLVLKQLLEQPFWQSSFFLRQVKNNYSELLLSLRRQVRHSGLSAIVANSDLQNFLSLLSNLAEVDVQWWQEALDSLSDSDIDELIVRTITAGRSIGTLHFALRQLQQTNPALLQKLEEKIGVKRYLQLITRAGTIVELLRTIEYSSPAMMAELIEALDDQTLDGLIARTLAAGRSIGTLHLALRELQQTDSVLLHRLEQKIGAARYLHLITRAGTILELLRTIEYSSPAMVAELIESLDEETLDQLIAQTLAAGRSIGTLSFALRQLQQTDPALLHKLEEKIGAGRYLHLIIRAGTILELLMIIQYSSPAMMAELIEALDEQALDGLIARTLAAGRSIGTLHLALRELQQTDSVLLHRLDQKIGAARYLHLIARAGTIFELLMIIRYSSPAMVAELIESLDEETLDQLIDQTLAVGRSIGTLDLALRQLRQTDPALLQKLEERVGAKGWWRLIHELGTMRELTGILQRVNWQFRKKMVQEAAHFPPAEWQRLLSRGDFADLCLFVRWRADLSAVLFTPALLDALKPTMEALIAEADHGLLIRGAALLGNAPDSAGKQCLMQLLRQHLAEVELHSLSFDSLAEAAAYASLLWKYRPAQRPELMRSLPALLPLESAWHEDEHFLRVSRSLFRLLADPMAPPDIARQLLHVGNSPSKAALCAKATTLDIFLYLWNFYALWYQWQQQAEERFTDFLDPAISDAVSKEVAKRFQSEQQEIDNLISLVGFLSYVDIPLGPVEKNQWKIVLPPLGELVKRVSRKTFIPAVFFLLGLEWLYDRKVWPNVWGWIVPKAKAYGESTAALDALARLADGRVRG